MEFDYVLNPKSGMTFKVVPQEKVDPREFVKRYENYVPHPPFKSPYVDEISIFLFSNQEVLSTLVHYSKNYGCIDPVFICKNKFYPMIFPLSKLFIPILESLKRDSDEKIPEWIPIVRQAILKLQGKLSMSAGAD